MLAKRKRINIGRLVILLLILLIVMGVWLYLKLDPTLLLSQELKGGVSQKVEKNESQVKVVIQKPDAFPEECLKEYIWKASGGTVYPVLMKEIIDTLKTTKFPVLLTVLMEVESRFVPSAKSSAKALGLTQVRWEVWGRELQEQKIAMRFEDLYNPSNSIKAGEYILMKYYSATRDLQNALKKYVGDSGLKGEAYSQRILQLYGNLVFKIEQEGKNE